MEAVTIPDSRFDIFTASFQNIEISDDHQRAIILLPLMHIGANKKGLFWTAKMLKKIAPLFRSVPYRYDLEGAEGSSHTINKLSSPHFDVGWTHSSEDGAWFDTKTKTLWTKGEVTHPDVISKLGRVTSDGKREVNYGSMGVIVEDAICSICGADMEANICENGHERLNKYDGKTCYKVPTEISKALHVALTNDPADGEAEIKNVLFQEMGDEMKENNFQKKGTEDTSSSNQQTNSDQTKNFTNSDQNNSDTTPADMRNQAGAQMDKSQLDNQIPGGLATSSPQTEQPGMAPSPQTILKDLAERIKTIEQKVSSTAMQEGSPELVNAAPQDQFTQDNMGTTSQFVGEKNDMEDSKVENNVMSTKVDKGQTSNAKTSVNPNAKEYQEGMMGGDPMQQIMGMLQQILQRMGGAEMQDMGKESLDASKNMAKKAQDDIPTEHVGPGDAVGNTEDEGNVKNKKYMQKPGMVATADGTEEAPTESVEDKVEESEEKEEEEESTEDLKKEVADMKEQMKAMRSKLEISDSGNVPEFGGSNATKAVEVADMGAKGRTDKFGEYGAWDSIFNGATSAGKFAR